MGNVRSAVILTAYNRPTMIVDAIESVLEQEPRDWRLYLLDDGSDSTMRQAINDVLLSDRWPAYELHTIADGALDAKVHPTTGGSVVWWQGPQRTMEQRKSCISYSMLINLALNYLLADEPYVTYLCDDDYLLPGSLAARADYLDANPDVRIVYGRLRSIQFGEDGSYNTWIKMSSPHAGRAWVPPDGECILGPDGTNAKYYYRDGHTDPATGLEYVEAGFWVEGPTIYGQPGKIDHNQPLIRRSCLAERSWPSHTSGYLEYWCESRDAHVGDAAFFQMLAQWPFYGIDHWVVTKRYHAYSDGASDAEVRE